MNDEQQAAIAAIRVKCPDFKPVMGIVLGSGLSRFCDGLTDAVVIDYDDIPGFPKATIVGQSVRLVLGYLSGLPVACLSGRSHYYEGNGARFTQNYIRVLRALGCDVFLATNAAGSLREEVGPGEIVMINDHINFQGVNPLVGENDDSVGPRFVPLDNVYNDELRTQLHDSAKDISLNLHEGVYISVLGPTYETKAEIRAFKMWGAHMVGMSTVPEVILAHHCGMRVAVLSIVSNFATGLTDISHDHNTVVANADKAAEKLTTLITTFAAKLK